jgi:iron(III) transport system substrate-binding protein
MKRTNLVIILVLLIVGSVFLLAFQTWIAIRQGPLQQIHGAELFPGETELYSKARQEGGLTIYTVWDTGEIAAILGAFSKQYPELTADYWAARNPEILARVLNEFQAGQRTVDVILADSSPPVIRSAGAISPYQTIQKDFLLINDPTMPVVSLQIQVLAYNTGLLARNDLPKTWEDVTSTQYVGRVALDDPLRAGPLSQMLAALYAYWDNQTRWVNFVRGLRSMNATPYQSTSEMFRLLVAGEYAIAMPALLHDVLDEQRKGGPVDFVRTAPPIVAPTFAATYAYAPHPNAAKLFAEWLISEDGQRALDSVGRAPVRKGFKGGASVEAAFPESTEVIGLRNQEYMANPKAWLNQYVKPIWEGASQSSMVLLPGSDSIASEEERSLLA